MAESFSSGGITRAVDHGISQESRIVLGIDYGTTYTGLAWMQTKAGENESLDDLTVFINWPEKDAQKVPSEFSYSRSIGKKQQWGYSMSADADVIKWTKLELESRTTVRELEVLRELVKGLDLVNKLRGNENAALTNDIPRHLSRSAEDVVRDYLCKVSREWHRFIKGQAELVLDTVPLDIVLTHPASWTYEAKNKTFRAVMGAFPKGMFPTRRTVSLTSEPEACALYNVQDMLKKNRNSLIPGECFVLCDAGGGTVDLVSYRADSVEPLKLTRVGGISGGKYGASFIDLAFLEWVRPKVETNEILSGNKDSGGHFIIRGMGRTLLNRFQPIKHEFSGTETGNITLPRGTVAAAGQEDSIVNGVISLTEADLKNMFEKCVKGTIRLIAQQVTWVENAALHRETPHQVTNLTLDIENIFLAGGFSENNYLLNEVKKWAELRGDIHVQRLDYCWSGVVQGAVLRGTGRGMGPAVKVNWCARHYGICVLQSDALDAAPAKITWLVHKGDLILPDEPLVSTLDVDCKFRTNCGYEISSGQTIRVTFVANVLDSPPADWSELDQATTAHELHPALPQPLVQNEVVHLDIGLYYIPRASIEWARGAGCGPFTGTVSVRISLDVSHEVKVGVTLTRGGKELRTYKTGL